MSGEAPRVYKRPRRKLRFTALTINPSRRARFMARAGAILFLGAALLHGLNQGGHLDYDGSPWLKLPGKLSGFVGMAADDIHITGLVHQEPETVLSAIGVKPGGTLIGFDAVKARRTLENLDWVSTATVQRLFPNQLEVSITERVPFAIWQRDGTYYVIDRSGAAMSSVEPSRLPQLPLVTGEGAHRAAEELINHLEAFPALMLKTRAAARVGQRRWTLYLDNGVTIALPETGEDKALARVQELDAASGLLSKGIRSVDLRIAGRMAVETVPVEEPKGKEKKVKLSLIR
jgi:cell division protein FtsQ